LAIELHESAYNVLVAPKPSLPQTVTENGNLLVSGLMLLWQEHATDKGFDSQCWKETMGNCAARDPVRGGIAGKIKVARLKYGHMRESL